MATVSARIVSAPVCFCCVFITPSVCITAQHSVGKWQVASVAGGKLSFCGLISEMNLTFILAVSAPLMQSFAAASPHYPLGECFFALHATPTSQSKIALAMQSSRIAHKAVTWPPLRCHATTTTWRWQWRWHWARWRRWVRWRRCNQRLLLAKRMKLVGHRSATKWEKNWKCEKAS